MATHTLRLFLIVAIVAAFIFKEVKSVNFDIDTVAVTGYPYVVSLRNDRNMSEHICTGVIIDQKTILTTALCAESKLTHVVAGIQNLREEGTKYEIHTVIIHHYYKKSSFDSFNAALLKLKHNISYTPEIDNINLEENSVEEGHAVYVTWRYPPPLFLQDNGLVLSKAHVRIIQSKNFPSLLYSSSANMFEFCNASGGGPLVRGSKLIGFREKGQNDCESVSFLYSNITNLFYWIKHNNDSVPSSCMRCRCNFAVFILLCTIANFLYWNNV